MDNGALMGQQVRCRAEFGGKSSDGTAQLETDHLVFRGDFRISIPLKVVRFSDSHTALKFVIPVARR